MIRAAEDRLLLSGPLTIATAAGIFKQGLPLMAERDQLLDYDAVVGVDSSSVSMLLGWMRAAQAAGYSLQVVNLPEDMISLAKLYGLFDLLPLTQVEAH